MAAFVQGLQQLGWTEGRNVRIELAIAAGDADPLANMRPNWSPSRRTSFWLLAARSWARCYGRLVPCRSCS